MRKKIRFYNIKIIQKRKKSIENDYKQKKKMKKLPIESVKEFDKKETRKIMKMKINNKGEKSRVNRS